MSEEDRTKLGRSLGLLDTLIDTLGTSVVFIDNEGLLVGLKDGIAERDNLKNGRDLGFAETNGTVLGTKVGDTDRDVWPLEVTLSLPEEKYTKVKNYLGYPTSLVIRWSVCQSR